MRRRSGFTIVELLVVIVIIVILLTLSTVSLIRNQANARDAERNTDMANVARGLETRYKEGNPRATASYIAAGSYPSTNEMSHILGQTVAGITPTSVSGGYAVDALPGTNPNNFAIPGGTGYSNFVYCTSSCGAAKTASDLATTLNAGNYYYQPIDASGNVCVSATCVRYQLFWKTEVDSVVHTIESKHQ